jgi:sulfate/thiosulfate transport system substrate-binding protein
MLNTQAIRRTLSHGIHALGAIGLWLGWGLGMGIVFVPSSISAGGIKILNVSYDPTRELYEDFNRAFAVHWKSVSGQDISIYQSHGGSGKQARSVIEGLDADIVTLALAYDIDKISAKSQFLPANWQTLLPKNSCPYTSTIVFLVRKGNPKQIKDWDDLVRPGLNVVTANPKTSGGARWNYLAAWTYALEKHNQDSAQARGFVAKIYRNVSVLDAGSRGSTTTFVQRRIGDIAITWENEALLAVKKLGKNNIEIIVPSISILAEPPVAVVERMATKHGNYPVAKAYLEYLYSDEGQDIIGRNFYRPRSEKASLNYASQFPITQLFTIDEKFGGWKKAQQIHFSDGGVFDQIFKEAR